ncbi:unnamed protein product [Hymenolepis diminuta]|uniref:Transcription initiation factor TFIID subunit 8 n=1 Tax=Hymenolepis diminuta TaxID=6216 RepID=A0A564YJ06_HYMDI|nr:unnamed protein product [Hymenolepis diminuta]
MKDGFTLLLENFIANLASQFGFQNIERPCLNVLINLYLSFFESIGSKSLTYAEAANRSKVVLNDVVLALIDFGLDVNRLLGPVRPNISGTLNEPASRCIPPRGITTESVLGMNGTRVVCVQPSLRSEIVKPVVPAASSSIIASTNVPTPPKAPAHLFIPPLPDPHTYLFTKVTRPLPANSMVGLRRLKLDKRRKTQVSLMHYVALRQEPHYLFPLPAEAITAVERMELATCSMVLLPSTSSRPYVSALMTEETDINDDDNEKDQKIEAKRPKLSEKDGNSIDSTGTNFFLSKPIFPVDVPFNAFV